MSGTLSSAAYVGSGSGNSGSDSGTTIVAGGLQYVGYDYGTGSASATTIDSGGAQAVGYSGGFGAATNTTINSGGYQDVGDVGGTGTVSVTTINSGGTQYVGYNSGIGSATDTTINGGLQYVGDSGGTGTASGTTINGGTQYVGDNYGSGTASSTTILSGGEQEVGIHGGVGTATGTTIDNGGKQFVGYQLGTGTASGTTVSGGGIQAVGYLGGTGTASDTTVNGGEQDIGDGTQSVGTAINATISNGGIQYVGYNYGSGSASGTTIDSGGKQSVGFNSGTGMATDTTVNNGGEQDVGAGGTATGTNILSGGLAHILSGGVADAPVIDGGTLKMDAGASIGSGGISFAASAHWGTLDLTGMGTFATSFTTEISGFAGTGSTSSTSDVIEVAGQTGTEHLAWTQMGGTGTLQVLTAANAVLESLTLQGSYAQSDFQLVDLGNTDEITCICFMAGTLVRTPDGEAAIETLKPGDLVLTSEGAAKPVNWLGRQTISTIFSDPLRVLPIRVRAGALDDNVPARDLLVSPDHALLVDDVLIHAGALVNGTSIVRETAVPKVFTYYHVELDDHSLILAENTPAETFIDNVDRLNFDNWAEFEALYPEGKAVEELPYPRAKATRQVPTALRGRLSARALHMAPGRLIA